MQDRKSYSNTFTSEFCRVIYSNVDSLLNKKSEVLSSIDQTKPDIIAFTEIRAKNQLFIPLDSEYEIPGYDMFLSRGVGRGIVLYFKQELNAEECYELNTHNFKESLWCTFKDGNNKKVLVGCVYRSPNSSLDNNELLYSLLMKDEIQCYNKICIMGDFNFPSAKWDGTWSGDRNNQFIECIRDAFLIQTVTQNTRHREGQQSTMDDLILVNDDLLISDIKHSAPLGKSDHDVLSFDLYVSTKNNIHTSRYKYNLAKGNYAKLKEYIVSVDFPSAEGITVETLWLSIKEAVLFGMDQYIPKLKINEYKKVKPSWMTKKVLRKIKKKHKLYKRYLQTKHGMDYQKYITMRNKCNRQVKKAKKCYENTIAKECRYNPKKFWKYVQEKTKSNQGVSALKKEDGTYAVSDSEKADTLNDFFPSVFVAESKFNIPNLEKCLKSGYASISEIRVTPEVVRDKLNQLDSTKVQGPDGIPPRVLKELSNELATPLCRLFNLSLETGQLPHDWKSALVTSIFKKGTRSDPGNYRPVSLTCIVCKVLESIVRDVIVTYFNDNNLYSKCQHGFRKGRSCVTQLLQVMEDLTTALDENNYVDIIYLDFRKAFDTVPHERLLQKLGAYGITGCIANWIKNFLANRIQAVRIGESVSRNANVLSGIPQGSVLGPLLFTIFINDLPESIVSTCKVFADDTKIYNASSKCVQLQHDLDRLYSWSELWKLQFNVGKCKVLHVGKRNPKHNYKMRVDDNETLITVCEEEKDLGVTFDRLLSFDIHIKNCVNKANQMVGLVKRTFSYLDKETFGLLYKALVRPHLEYANVIWFPGLKRQSVAIEKVQRRATKLLSECKSMSYKERLSYLGLHSLYGRRVRGDLIQVYKIYKGLDDIKWSDFFVSPFCTNTRNSEGKIFINHCFTNKRKFSFSNRVAKHWNELPLTLKNSRNINEFKNQLDIYPKFKDLLYSFDQ